MRLSQIWSVLAHEKFFSHSRLLPMVGKAIQWQYMQKKKLDLHDHVCWAASSVIYINICMLMFDRTCRYSSRLIFQTAGFKQIFFILHFNPAIRPLLWSVDNSVEDLRKKKNNHNKKFAVSHGITIVRFWLSCVILMMTQFLQTSSYNWIELDLRYLLYETSWIGEVGNKQGIKYRTRCQPAKRFR
jgi:hypothetical protein